jgi:hypothetical protein
MPLKTKIYLFLSIFFICSLLYFLLPLLFPQYHLVQNQIFQPLDIFKNPSANFALVIVIFLLLAIGGVKLLEIIYRYLTGTLSKKSRLGRYLLAENFITDEELKAALEEQNFRIGEILVQHNRITPQELETALKSQKSSHQRIGAVLKELGYATDEDVRFAVEKLNRRLGDILKDRQCLTEYDLQCALTMQQYSALDD